MHSVNKDEQEQRGSRDHGISGTAKASGPEHAEPPSFVTVALGGEVHECRQEWSDCELEPPTQSYSDKLWYWLRLTPAIAKLGCICSGWARYCFKQDRGGDVQDTAEKL